MKTSFGIINNNIFEISDWHQLLHVSSEFKDIALLVNDVKDHICEGISISIYNNISKLNYVTFFVALYPLSSPNILNAFGFKVKFVDDSYIEEAAFTYEFD